MAVELSVEGSGGGSGEVELQGTPATALVYPKFLYSLLTGAIPESLATADLKVLLAKSPYWCNPADDEFLSDVVEAARGGISPALAGKTFTGGVCDADDLVFGAVAAGDECDYMLTVVDTGDAATSPLVSYAPGLGYTPTGKTPRFTWGAGGLWSLAAGDDGTNVLYPKLLEALCLKAVTGGVAAQDLKAVLLTSGYTFSAAHQWLSDVGAGTRVATSEVFTGVTVTTDGKILADAARVGSFTGDAVTKLVVYAEGASEGASRLVSYHEVAEYTPSGVPVVLSWSAEGVAELTELVAV